MSLTRCAGCGRTWDPGPADGCASCAYLRARGHNELRTDWHGRHTLCPGCRDVRALAARGRWDLIERKHGGVPAGLRRILDAEAERQVLEDAPVTNRALAADLERHVALSRGNVAAEATRYLAYARELEGRRIQARALVPPRPLRVPQGPGTRLHDHLEADRMAQAAQLRRAEAVGRDRRTTSTEATGP